MVETPADVTREIIRYVAAKHGVEPSDFLVPGVRLPPRLSRARAEIAFRLRYERGFSYPVIGRILRYNDHTSVMHSVLLHRRVVGDAEAAAILAARQAASVAAAKRRGPRPVLPRSFLADRMQERLNSGTDREAVVAVRYFLFWDGFDIRWTAARVAKRGKPLAGTITRLRKFKFNKCRVLWILLTGAIPVGPVVCRSVKGQRRLGVKTVFCNGESLHDYMLRVQEYGCLYRSPGRVEETRRAQLSVLPALDDGRRSPSADARPSRSAKVPALAHRESYPDRLPALQSG